MDQVTKRIDLYTKSFSKRSDFEINRMIAELQGYPVSSVQTSLVDGGSKVLLDNGFGEYDPTNNAVQGYKIMFDNGISLVKDDYGKWIALIMQCIDSGFYKLKVEDRPLRAVMIVYLLLEIDMGSLHYEV